MGNIHNCDGCSKLTPGIRPAERRCEGHAGLPPYGFVVVERCDACEVYGNDLEAARAWGYDAQWQDGRGTSQAIARPRHTPGDWHVSLRSNGTLFIESSNGSQVAIVYGAVHREANARLIAAAPDMLAAIEAFIADADRNIQIRSKAWRDAVGLGREVLAKIRK